MKHLYSSAGCLYELYSADVCAARIKRNATPDGSGNQQKRNEASADHFFF